MFEQLQIARHERFRAAAGKGAWGFAQDVGGCPDRRYQRQSPRCTVFRVAIGDRRGNWGQGGILGIFGAVREKGKQEVEESCGTIWCFDNLEPFSAV